MQEYKAITLFSKGIELHPGNPKFYRHRGHRYLTIRQIIENTFYCNRLVMYKGLRTPESVLDPKGADDLTIATQGYGVGNWYLYNRQPEKAKEIFNRVLVGKHWAAFDYLAAEAEIARTKR